MAGRVQRAVDGGERFAEAARAQVGGGQAVVGADPGATDIGRVVAPEEVGAFELDETFGEPLHRFEHLAATEKGQPSFGGIVLRPIFIAAHKAVGCRERFSQLPLLDQTIDRCELAQKVRVLQPGIGRWLRCARHRRAGLAGHRLSGNGCEH